MAIAEGNSTSIDSDTESDWVALKPGVNRLLIVGVDAGASRIDIQYSHDAVTAFTTNLQNLVVDSTHEFIGVSGYIRMAPHYYDSGEISLVVLNAITDRLWDIRRFVAG